MSCNNNNYNIYIVYTFFDYLDFDVPITPYTYIILMLLSQFVI